MELPPPPFIKALEVLWNCCKRVPGNGGGCRRQGTVCMQVNVPVVWASGGPAAARGSQGLGATGGPTEVG